jgi:regulator of PEP synthase PpsR (kinase-PPPase family)
VFQIDHRRVIGLIIDPDQLLTYRKNRQRRMGTGTTSKYADLKTIYEEVKAVRRIYQRNGFSIIDVTNKSIEASADEVIELITSRFGSDSHKD